ncbi:MAG TPA: hypothetical protein VEQ12_04780 [Candidatus Limnocylindria bacterium]|nr:hypothetical protein [Candidatus Limnocylindria bacterium]
MPALGGPAEVVTYRGIGSSSRHPCLGTGRPGRDRPLIGTCVENVGGTGAQGADCAGRHSGKIVPLSHDRGGCPSDQVWISLDDGAYACSDPKQ